MVGPVDKLPMFSDLALLNKLYGRFNARDMDAALALMHPDVEWANGMEGGHVNGHQGVRVYWTRQWAEIDPHVDPMTFNRGPDQVTVVEVHQTVRDLAGQLLSDQTVHHIFTIEDGLVRRFEIRHP
jgi:ketosteroid isomerase-like protein